MPCPAPLPRRVPPRLDRPIVSPGFGFDKLNEQTILCIRTLIYINACRVQNSNIPQAVRIGATHGGAAGRGGAQQTGTPTSRVGQKLTVSAALLSIVDRCPEHPFASRNEGNPM